MNSIIEELFSNYSVPVAFMYYREHADSYITYQQTQIDTTFSADDELQNYVDYYDVDVYSKSNYLQIIDDVIEIMETGGFRWQPEMCSGDMYEEDTRYFHKTLCFSIERAKGV